MLKKTTNIALAALVLCGAAACTGKNNKADNVQETARDSAALTIKQFQYTAPTVKEGALSAVVELGASGFNAFIIRRDASNWEMVKALYGNSNVIEGAATPDAVDAKLKAYIQNLLDEAVAGKNIHFVVSSGATKESVITEVIAGLKRQGYVVNQVTPNEEAEYGYYATVPESFRDKAFFVDMGSGNTKVAYMKGGQLVTKETYGTKFFTKNITPEVVQQEIAALAAEIPAEQRQHCFIIGGVPYQIAKFQNGGNTEKDFITLSPKAEEYAALVKDDKKVKSGLTIYAALLDEMKETEYVVFNTKTNFTIGYLLRTQK